MTTLQPPVEAPGRRAAPVAAPGRSGRPRTASVLVLGFVAAVACSPLAYGDYAITAWAPLGVAALILLLSLALRFGAAPLTEARTAAAGLGLLVALSFASLIWAQSRDSAWTAANQLAVYGVVFLIGLLALRERETAWAALVLLGLPALLTAGVLAVEFAAGTGGGAFMASRLAAPMGYVNATAALLVMGVWPWLGLAERLQRPAVRALALAAATLIAGTVALTQTRAALLAAAVSVVLALLVAPGRGRRCLHLLIVLGGAITAAPWTLRVYSSTGPTHLGTPPGDALRGAGLALLGAAVTAAGLELLGGAIWLRLAPGARSRLAGLPLGRGLLALAAAVLLIGGIAERGRIAAQWHDFTTLNEERAVNDRFLALGAGPRDELWRIAIAEFAAAPLGGVGAGNYALQEYRRRHALEHASSPHSLELQMLAELGAGGGVGLLLFLTPVLGAGLRESRRRLTVGDPALRVAALGIFSAWLAGASVDWLYQIPGLTGTAMLAAGMLLAPGGAAAPRAPTRRWPAATVWLVALALLAASLGRQYGAALYGDSGASLVRTHPLRALQELRSAEQLDPWSMQTLYDVAAAYARLDDYSGARAALLRAARLEPENYVPPALLGDIARRAGDRALALSEYRRALALDPLEPALRRAIAATAPR